MTPEIIILSIVYLLLETSLSLFGMLFLFNKKLNISIFLAYSLNRILYYIFNAIDVFYPESVLPSFAPIFGAVITILTTYFFFDKNIGRGILKIWILEVYYSLASLILSTLFKGILDFKYCTVLFSAEEDYYSGIITVTISCILLLPPIFVLRKFLNKELPNIVYTLATFVLIITTISSFIFSSINGQNIFSYEYYTALMLSISVMVLAAIMIYNNMKTEKHLRQENEYLTRLNELQYEHYAALNDYQQQLRVMRHDIVNHLHTMQIMTDNGDTAECRDYADELIGQYKSIYTTLCENKPVDALLHSKMSEAQGKNITLTANVSISEDTRIKPVDLVCIFSNLLDNAITAAESSEKKTVAISAAEKNDMLTIKCENSFSGSIKIRKDFTVKTTKGDSFHHGLGTGIIKSTAEKYGGSVFCETAGDTFTYIVSIPNNINELKGENHA